jgi:lipoprotein-anchoring transpeptidase ErfK/SrfK
MRTDPESAKVALQNSRQALQQGDRLAARRWAEKVIALDPALEEPWLILAAAANPRASMVYLERALQINPQSEQARRGMHWAIDHLRKEPRKQPDPAIPAKKLGRIGAPRPASFPQTTTRSMFEKTLPATIAEAGSAPSSQLFKSLAKYRWSFMTLLVLAVCLTAVLAFSPGNASPALAFLRTSQSVPQVFGAPITVDKPTNTPSPTASLTPTITFTPTLTSTFTPTPTATFTPTETFPPTLTPQPTNTPRPRPTNTPYVPPEYTGNRWIDVNLSQQMLYAYEGDIVVASFLVSTGVPAFPTVTGQYHIYIKLVSTLMAGDGYYLPNVPYTMYFYKGYGIHGTYWHNNFGVPMSHGCVNMYTPDAEWLFHWASEGMLVNIHY